MISVIVVTDKRRGKIAIVASHVVAVYCTDSGSTCVATTGGKFYIEESVEDVLQLLKKG